jgi:tetratricopeptide (TPR) repeat protein
MRPRSIAFFIAIFIALSGSAATSWSQPQTVPKMTDRMLDKASYIELAKQWNQYIEENGESVDALVNLGMAHEYSQQKDAALIAARRAAEIGPDNPKALAYLAKLLAKHNIDEKEAIRLLERCISIEPDHELGLINLATIYLKSGELDKADKIFKTTFEQNIVYRPLQDFAYNMLVGLPEGAVLITNGDSDTFPALVLQAGMNFRQDIAVINRHLLRIDAYADAIYDRYPSIKPKGDIQADHPIDKSIELLEKMVDDDKIEVHFALSVNLSDLGFSPELVCDGLTQRSSKKGLTTDEAATLFLETFRLDSATDWNFAWDLLPSVSHLLSNYVISIIHLVEDGTLSGKNRKKLLAKAMEIAEFHEMERLSIIVKSMQKREK